MLLAGPLPLQGALNHWGRYLPKGPTICILCASGGGHSLCRAPLTTGVDIYPRVLPSACCVLLAGPLPLQSALNHWGRYLPQGPTICILCVSGTHTHTHWTLPTTMSVLETPLQGALNHWGRILPQGPTIQNNQLKKRVCVKILDFDLYPPPPLGMDTVVWHHEMKANPTGYL